MFLQTEIPDIPLPPTIPLSDPPLPSPLNNHHHFNVLRIYHFLLRIPPHSFLLLNTTLALITMVVVDFSLTDLISMDDGDELKCNLRSYQQTKDHRGREYILATADQLFLKSPRKALSRLQSSLNSLNSKG